MKKIIAKIAENKMLAQGFYRMRIESAYLAKNSKPGQFVEIRCSDGNEPLLRRPLGVHRIRESGIELLYGVVGKGTELLSKKKSGDTVDMIGPLGNGFFVHRKSYIVHRTSVLVAGGIGVAPLVALAEELAYSVERIAYRKKQKIYVLLGAKTRNHILCEDGFKKIGCEVLVSTEDGSKGKRGLATESLGPLLNAIRYPLNATIYACGPAAMLKTVAKIARAERIPCQVSLEERMACGVGVCLGCPVKVRTSSTKYEVRSTKYKYKMVCKDGPVFDAKEIAW